MHVKNKKRCPMRSTMSDYNFSLSYLEHVIHETMTRSTLYEAATPHESTGVNLGTARAFNSRLQPQSQSRGLKNVKSRILSWKKTSRMRSSTNWLWDNRHQTLLMRSPPCLPTSVSWQEPKLPKWSSPAWPRLTAKPKSKLSRPLQTHLKKL